VELVKAVAAISQNTRDLQQPVRTLVDTMAKDDQIILPGAADPMKKDEVKKALVKATRSKVTSRSRKAAKSPPRLANWLRKEGRSPKRRSSMSEARP
jgi:hypothetical protein